MNNYEIYLALYKQSIFFECLLEEIRYGKTVEDVPLSFKEFFQIRQT